VPLRAAFERWRRCSPSFLPFIRRLLTWRSDKLLPMVSPLPVIDLAALALEADAYANALGAFRCSLPTCETSSAALRVHLALLPHCLMPPTATAMW